MDLKTCIKCNIEKELSNFWMYKNRQGIKTYRNVCKTCQNKNSGHNTENKNIAPEIENKAIEIKNKPELIDYIKKGNTIFNDNEIAILKQIAKEYPDIKKSIQHNKIELHKTDNKRVRKTITIDEDLNNIISNKMTRTNLNYSDIINLLVRKSIEYID